MNIYIIVFAVYLVVLLVFGSIAAKKKKETTEDTHPGKSPSALFTEISVFVTALLRFAIKSFLTKELKIQSDIKRSSDAEKNQRNHRISR